MESTRTPHAVRLAALALIPLLCPTIVAADVSAATVEGTIRTEAQTSVNASV